MVCCVVLCCVCVWCGVVCFAVESILTPVCLLCLQAMLSLLENAHKICTTDSARSEYTKTLTSSPSSPASNGGSGSGAGSDFHLNDTTSATPALESMLVYTKFRGLGFRMRELGYMLRCSELSEEEGEGEGGQQVLSALDANKSAYSSEDFLNHFSTSRNTSAGVLC
jgi:hypothetical protein